VRQLLETLEALHIDLFGAALIVVLDDLLEVGVVDEARSPLPQSLFDHLDLGQPLAPLLLLVTHLLHPFELLRHELVRSPGTLEVHVVLEEHLLGLRVLGPAVQAAHLSL